MEGAYRCAYGAATTRVAQCPLELLSSVKGLVLSLELHVHCMELTGGATVMVREASRVRFMMGQQQGRGQGKEKGGKGDVLQPSAFARRRCVAILQACVILQACAE
eukprot:CAMPEP_0174749970 /NCGR_PEP_ID=MMETSP1094-20130205/96809_1 /TAXON_ID=156173 /ORGANISM="Chrysochromulina brevifilum, Strain UTEX LB 985" /LENGTH=105 /DNA_ID=CAMNT_0015955253 /DNA_START=266 /DNA_END=584 /DNA_ORIENTATION=-